LKLLMISALILSLIGDPVVAGYLKRNPSP